MKRIPPVVEIQTLQRAEHGVFPATVSNQPEDREEFIDEIREEIAETYTTLRYDHESCWPAIASISRQICNESIGLMYHGKQFDAHCINGVFSICSTLALAADPGKNSVLASQVQHIESIHLMVATLEYSCGLKPCHNCAEDGNKGIAYFLSGLKNLRSLTLDILQPEYDHETSKARLKDMEIDMLRILRHYRVIRKLESVSVLINSNGGSCEHKTAQSSPLTDSTRCPRYARCDAARFPTQYRVYKVPHILRRRAGATQKRLPKAEVCGGQFLKIFFQHDEPYSIRGIGL